MRAAPSFVKAPGDSPRALRFERVHPLIGFCQLSGLITETGNVRADLRVNPELFARRIDRLGDPPPGSRCRHR